MTASYRKIDYRIRPAKHVERLMMCEAFRRLRFGTLESYQYIGLGSVYFSDFALFHKALGINKMISLEREIHDKQRFIDNRPFANIEMVWGETTGEVPKLKLGNRSILWLDYDGTLSRSVLDDIRSIATRICGGSVLVVSAQCQPSTFDATSPRRGVNELAQNLGADRVDVSWDDEALVGWGKAKVFRQILTNELAKVLAERNGVLSTGQRIRFEQIFNFHYNDGVNMLTLGWVIFDEGQRPLFDLCNFDGLSFVEKGDAAFKIDIPKLTSNELRMLQAQMPLPDGVDLQRGSAPERDANHFKKIYRYFPSVAFVDL